ncbi:MAG: hypothetical protein OHK0012_27390 [Synechococcales cyanobacterium]
MVARVEEDLGRSIPVNRHGLVHLVATDSEWQEWQPTVTARQQAGLSLVPLQGEDLHRDYPFLPAQWIGALVSPADRQVSPTVLTLALVEAAQRYGADFWFQTPVRRWVSQGSRVTQVDTSQGTIHPGMVVLAAGLGSQPLAGIPLQAVKGEALKVFAPQIQILPVLTGVDLHIVPLDPGQFWIGATVEFHPETGDPTPLGQTSLLERAGSICPVLASATVVEHWAGHRPRPRQQRAPLLGFAPNLDNLVVATGHYRNGVLLAAVSAAVVKDLILTGTTTHCHWPDFAPPPVHSPIPGSLGSPLGL